jgi:hypothetical protein
MANPSAAVHQHLMPIDPVGALRSVVPDIDRFAQLDPKIARAKSLLVERLTLVLPADERDVLVPLLWLQFREEFRSASMLRALRLALGDGQWVLKVVEEALETTFSKEVLTRVIQEATQRAATESAASQELDRAREEWRAFTAGMPEDNPAALAAAAICVGVGVGIGIGIGVAVSEIAHHHWPHH